MKSKPAAKKKNRKPAAKKKTIPLRAGRNRISLLAKYHALVTLAVVLLYLGLGFAVDPKLLLMDMSEKYALAAQSMTTLQIVIHGPPAKPEVSAAAGCDHGAPYVQLNWGATNDTDSYDITRNGDPLVTGLASANYRDTNVVATTGYTYQVTANGPYGSATSDGASATTGDCFVALPPAVCAIVTINKTDLTDQTKIPKTTDRTPKLTGTTNMVYAVMRYEIYSGPVIVASNTANSNGYWTFTVPAKLDYGLHTIYVTATDPADPTRFFTATQNFQVVKEEEAASAKEPEKKAGTQPAAVPGQNPSETAAIPKEQGPPFNFNLSVENQDKLVYFGSDLNTNLKIIKLRDFGPEEDTVKYKITDVSGRTVSVWEKSVLVEAGAEINDAFRVPIYLRSGKYKIAAEIQSGKYLIEAENLFDLQERPLANLGGGLVITYPMIFSILGYLLIFCFLLLLLFLALLAREYWLAKQALRQIDENNLARQGYIS